LCYRRLGSAYGTPIRDSICKVPPGQTACKSDIAGSGASVVVEPLAVSRGSGSSGFGWYRVSTSSDQVQSLIQEVPGKCSYVSDSLVRGSIGQIDLCGMKVCSGAGVCLCPQTSSTSAAKFYHLIGGLKVGGDSNPEIIGERCASSHDPKRLTNYACGCFNDTKYFGSSSAGSGGQPVVSTTSNGCVIDSLDVSYCKGRGYLKYASGSAPSTGTCQCGVQFTGASCQFDCNSVKCNSNGICVKTVPTDPYSENTCECNPGFETDSCKYPTTAKIEQFSCDGHGIWTGSACVCDASRTSEALCRTCIYSSTAGALAGTIEGGCTPNCCKLDCNQFKCSGNGVCTKQGGLATTQNSCICNTGFSGADCSIPVTGNGECGGFGTYDSITKKCICSSDADLVGSICIKRCPSFTKDPPTCDRLAYGIGECSNNFVCGGPQRGICVNVTQSEMACKCKNGFTGLACENVACAVSTKTGDICAGSYCVESLGICICKAGFVGFACDIPDLSCSSGQVKQTEETGVMKLPKEYVYSNTDYKYV
jgi:hypothetical protein